MIKIDEPITSFPTMSSSIAGGVFPATITLTDALTNPMAALTTPFIYYPQDPETRLNLSLMLPLNAVPERDPNAIFRVTEEGGLSQALADNGWMNGYLAALEEATQIKRFPTPPRRRGRGPRPERRDPIPALRISVAPSPRLLEELDDMSDGFETEERTVAEGSPAARTASDALQLIETLVHRPAVQPVLVPYAFPDLPTLTAVGLPIEHILEQLDTARDVVEKAIGVRLDGDWLFPPAGRLDSESLIQLQRSPNIAENLFLADSSLMPPTDPTLPGCPQVEYSFTCAARVRTIEGTSTALIGDAGVTERLARLPLRNNDRLWIQQFFAETSMIREESPGVAERVVQATIPSLWHPTPQLSRLLLEGVRRAPWLNTVTGEEAVRAAEAADRNIVEQAPATSGVPEPAFFDAAEQASEVVDSYGKIVPADNQRIVRLKRNILTSMSRSFWRQVDVGESYYTEARSEAEQEMGKIKLQSSETFVFSARQGDLQFIVINGTDYPVKIALDLFSPNLSLTETELIDTYQPGNQPITVEATARTSGEFPIRVRLATPDGYPITETTIKIRSTSLNRIALTLTVGALAFLILFYVLRALRRRAAQPEASA